MKWYNIFNLNKPCCHNHVDLGEDYSYCPDCGNLVKTHWYITRCDCCGLKLRATIQDGEVVPQNTYCYNCGSHGYIVEEIDNIDCVNINFAIGTKEVVTPNILEYEQSWVEEAEKQKLLQYNRYLQLR